MNPMTMTIVTHDLGECPACHKPIEAKMNIDATLGEPPDSSGHVSVQGTVSGLYVTHKCGQWGSVPRICLTASEWERKHRPPSEGPPPGHGDPDGGDPR